MNIRQGRKNKLRTSGDKGSLRLLYILITIGYALSFSIGAIKIGKMDHWDAFFAVGVLLTVMGFMFRIQSIVTLKQYFTYSIAHAGNQKLIEIGLYKIIRHPGYSGQLMIFAGISTALLNWLSILFMMIQAAIGFAYRIKVEESFMIEYMGES
jgi:protein-S-isoprenylcysteine O-methyltransferase Ste14